MNSASGGGVGGVVWVHPGKEGKGMRQGLDQKGFG